MTQKTLNFIILIAVVVLLVWGIGFALTKKPAEVTPSPTPNPIATSTNTGSATSTQYVNREYGFRISLPGSWNGFTIATGTWKGDSINNAGVVQPGTVSGPMVSVRHPLWTAASPRQDIPVMVFSIAQWNDMQADRFHIGAAPINPSELGRNKQYVFGLPARYNFSYLTGYEEVDQIIQSHSFQAI